MESHSRPARRDAAPAGLRRSWRDNVARICCCGGMDVQDFRRLFADNIRALLAWDLLAAADACISERVITDVEELGRLSTVWYRDRHGGAGDWSDPSSTPQSVQEAVEHRQEWAHDRKDRVETFRLEYLRYSEPILMTIPAYKTSAGDLMLDSTHRAVAAYMSSRDVRVLIMAIEGPISAAILPDLSHFPIGGR